MKRILGVAAGLSLSLSLSLSVPAMEPDDWVYAHQLEAGKAGLKLLVTRFLTTQSACDKQSAMGPEPGSTVPRHPDGGDLVVSRNACELVKISDFLAGTRERYQEGAYLYLPEGAGFVAFLTPVAENSLGWCRSFQVVLEVQYWQQRGEPVSLSCRAL